MSFLFHKPDSIFASSKKEQQEAIDRLIGQGSLRSGYYLFLFLATLIVTPGLLLNNIAVIIGGMVLAPLMIPMLSISLSLVSGSLSGLWRSFRILVISIAICMTTAAVVSMFIERTGDVVSWIPAEISSSVYFLIAIASGVSGAFAWVKEEFAPTFTGITMAVSLLPPLASAGMALNFMQPFLLRNSLLLFTANLLGIILGALIVLTILGFFTAKKVEEKAIEKHE